MPRPDSTLDEWLREGPPRRDRLDERRALANARSALLASNQPLMLARYVLLDRLGSGGLGVVYRAYDPMLDRSVAIKLLHAAPGSSGRSRLLREAQAIAQLAHPNVVGVHDVGTYDPSLLDDEASIASPEEKGVFLVMELVPGSDLAQWLARTPRPGWSEGLAMMVGAGRGLAAAHARGILHRDFKPANVLVGDDGRARVADFGLARAIGGEAGSDGDGGTESGAQRVYRGEDRPSGEFGSSGSGLATPLTQVGMVLGTPAYMAPEQHRGRRLDARSDQYAFCVALHEVLYGARPFTGADSRSLLRAKEAGPPARPSGTAVPEYLHRVLERGLAVESDQRFPGMDALLGAIADDPAVRRRRRIVLLGVGGALAGAIGLGLGWHQQRLQRCAQAGETDRAVWEQARGSVSQRIRAIDAGYATSVWAFVDRQLEDRGDQLATARVQLCELHTLKGAITDAEAQARTRCLDRVSTGQQAVIEVLADADAQTLHDVVDVMGTIPHPRRCATIRGGIDDDAPAATSFELERTLVRATSLSASGRGDQARALVTAALDGLSGEPDGRHARVSIVQGKIAAAAEHHEDAGEHFERAWALAESVGDDDTVFEALLGLLALTAEVSQDAREVDRLKALAQAKFDRGLSEPLGRANLEYEVARVRYSQARYADTIAAGQRAREIVGTELGEDHPIFARIEVTMANALMRTGEMDEAQAAYQRALDRLEAALGETHPSLVGPLGGLSELEMYQGHHESALRHAQRALGIARSAFGPHRTTASALEDQGVVLSLMGHTEEALRAQQEALAIRVEIYGSSHGFVAQSHAVLAGLYGQLGRPERALHHADQAVKVGLDVYGDAHPRVADFYHHRGQAYGQLGRHEDAMSDLHTALKIYELRPEEQRPNIGRALISLSLARERAGVHDGNVASFERALELLADRGPADTVVAAGRFGLARAIVDREPARARSLAVAARQAFERAADPDHELPRLRQWLAEQEGPRDD